MMLMLVYSGVVIAGAKPLEGGGSFCYFCACPHCHCHSSSSSSHLCRHCSHQGKRRAAELCSRFVHWFQFTLILTPNWLLPNREINLHRVVNSGFWLGVILECWLHSWCKFYNFFIFLRRWHCGLWLLYRVSSSTLLSLLLFWVFSSCTGWLQHCISSVRGRLGLQVCAADSHSITRSTSCGPFCTIFSASTGSLISSWHAPSQHLLALLPPITGREEKLL